MILTMKPLDNLTRLNLWREGEGGKRYGMKFAKAIKAVAKTR